MLTPKLTLIGSYSSHHESKIRATSTHVAVLQATMSFGAWVVGLDPKCTAVVGFDESFLQGSDPFLRVAGNDFFFYKNLFGLENSKLDVA